MENISKEFQDILSQTPYNRQGIEFIAETMKKIHANKKLFKYIFERCYASNRNPFTTLYHEYVDYLRSGYQLDKVLHLLANNLLERISVEKECGIYTVY